MRGSLGFRDRGGEKEREGKSYELRRMSRMSLLLRQPVYWRLQHSFVRLAGQKGKRSCEMKIRH